MMNQTKLPANLKSIILSINNELSDNYHKQSHTEFIDSVSALLDYYIPSIYEHSVHEQMPDTFLEEYKKHIAIFTTTLLDGMQQCEYTCTYDEIFEIIVNDIIRTTWGIQLLYADDFAIIPNESACNTCIALSKLITTVNEAKSYIKILHPLEVSIVTNIKTKEIHAADINFTVPNYMVKDLNKLAYKLSKYKQYITYTDLTFTNDLSYAKYMTVYKLMKDKLLQCDLTEFQNHWAELNSHKYIADDCYAFENYLYDLRAETSYQEYFMSCVCAYINDNEQLKIFDNTAYKLIRRLLDGEV